MIGLDAWKSLYRLAHLDKQKAYQVYRDRYLATNKRVVGRTRRTILPEKFQL